MRSITTLALGAALFMPATSALAQLADPIPGVIPPSAVRIDLTLFADGLVAPNLATHAGDGTGRLFVVDQPGQVHGYSSSGTSLGTFLDMQPLLVEPRPGFDERGLLGLAFHPDFATAGAAGAGKLYTYSSEPTADFTVATPDPSAFAFNHQSVVSEWRVSGSDANRVDPASRRVLMRVDQPQFNHNAGMLTFGPDRMLYVGLGDGGGGGDDDEGHGTIGNGQDSGNVLGTLLRVDVDGSDSGNAQYGIPADNPFVADAGVPDEIFATGLRNPYRFSFDRETGDLVVADVGQGNIEEIDIVTAGGNYGWRLKEGSFAFNPADSSVSDDLTGLPAGLIDPVAEYDHDEGLSIIGGFVYRGEEMPGLFGKYVFGDFSTGFSTGAGRIFAADLSTGDIEELLIGSLGESLGLFIKGFGEDEAGELYLLASSALAPVGDTGMVFRIAETAPIPLPAAGFLLLGALGLLAARARSGERRV